MSRPSLDEEVYSIVLALRARGIHAPTVRDVVREAERRGLRASERGIRYALARLVDRGRLVRLRGRPARFVPAGETTLELHLGAPYDSGMVTEEREREEPVERYLADLLERGARLESVVEEHAEEIAGADPVEVLVEMASWLAERFHRCVRRWGSADPARRGALEDELQRIEALVRRYYGNVLSVPLWTRRVDPEELEAAGDLRDLRELPWDSRVAPIGIRLGRGAQGYLAVHRGLLRDHLTRVILGRSVAEERPLADPEEIWYVTGHDTSFWPIRLVETAGGLLPRYMRAELYVLAGIIYRTWRVDGRSSREPGVRAVWDVIPEPAELPSMGSRTALARGYVLTPDLLDVIPEPLVRKTVEAQMNVLEYNLARDLLTPGAVVGSPDRLAPITPPNVLLHDGRLAPYEHKLDDLTYHPPHGTIVRRALAGFLSLIDAVERSGVTMVGVVKRPGIVSILPVILWVLRDLGELSDKDLLRLALNPRLEQRLAAALFRGLRRSRGSRPGVTRRTFAVVRSLWAMDGKTLAACAEYARDHRDPYREDFWLDVPRFPGETQERPGIRGLAEERGLEYGAEEIISRALARTRVAVFYYDPPVRNLTGEVVLPRFEVLLPPSARREAWIRRVDSALLPTTPPGPNRVRLLGYELRIIDDGSEGGRMEVLILPDHVHLADEYARYYDRQLRAGFSRVLQEAVARILRERGLLGYPGPR
ncbi:MAG: hypothetical protein QI223_08090 [Candidatus Korarchaeota archaeon]|nr:hypothetical protein [Candidatus Korarchaeota archaeon]